MARRIGSYVLGAAACAVLFLIPSAYAAGRGAPAWAAAIAGALAFPLLPVAWHVVAERRRKRAAAAAKPAAKSSGTLTPVDRFVLRLIAVAVVALGPLLALDAGGVWRGLRDHATWFIPEAAPVAGVAADLLEQVPPEAEGVMVVRSGSGLFARVPPLESSGAVLAIGDGKALLAAAPALVKPEPVERLRQWIASTQGKTAEPIDVLTRGAYKVAASRSWLGKSGGPNPAVRAELARAPAAAVVAIGIAPTTSRDALSVRAAAMWVTANGTEVVIEGRVEALDEAAAVELEGQAKSALPLLPVFAPDGCREVVKPLVDGIALARAGAVITARVAMTRDQYNLIAGCRK